MNYYQHHIGDFRSGSIHMTRMERWIYRDMIDVYYDTEKALPLDSDLICNMIGARADDERKIVANLLHFKFRLSDDGYHHGRCDQEIAAYHLKATVAQANGKLGGRPKKKNPEEPSGFPSGFDSVAICNPAVTGSKTNHKPITINHKPISKETTAFEKPSASPDMFKGIPDQLVSDFKALRKLKRAPVTQTAIDGIKREADKAGITLEDALSMCCERGWSGFNADWVGPQGGQGKGAAPAKQSRHSGFEKIDYSEGIGKNGRIL